MDLISRRMTLADAAGLTRALPSHQKASDFITSLQARLFLLSHSVACSLTLSSPSLVFSS